MTLRAPNLSHTLNKCLLLLLLFLQATGERSLLDSSRAGLGFRRAALWQLLPIPPTLELPSPSPIKCCFLSPRELGVSYVLCKIKKDLGESKQNQKSPGRIAVQVAHWLSAELGCSNLNPERERGRGQGRGASPFPPGRGLRLRPAALPIHPQSRSQTEPKVPRARSLAHVSPWGERQLPHLPVSHVLGGLGLVASSLWTSVFLKRELNSISPRSLQVPPRTLPAVTCFSQI